MLTTNSCANSFSINHCITQETAQLSVEDTSEKMPTQVLQYQSQHGAAEYYYW